MPFKCKILSNLPKKTINALKNRRYSAKNSPLQIICNRLFVHTMETGSFQSLIKFHPDNL